MRNGSKSDPTALVDGAGDRYGAGRDIEDSASDSYASSAPDEGDVITSSFAPASSIVLFVVVSAACAAAAVAAGTYALWLARQKAARETLTDVQDLLRVCQDRMHQMEDDLSRLPKGLSSQTA